MGSKWAKLSKVLHGRTDNSIKNHWNSIMRKKMKDYQSKLDSHLFNFPGKDRIQVISEILGRLGSGEVLSEV